jgi:hypothetical protein
LEPSKVGEGDTKEKGKKVFKDSSVSDMTIDNPGNTGDQVFSSFSIEVRIIIPRQPGRRGKNERHF